jgi:uncharacterized protein YndB with AHSA1/START domain
MTENFDLTMERTYPAPPRAVYDAFLGMYGENRPDWIVESHLDPRRGGSWRVVFHPPGLEAFTEDRVLSAIEPPHRLAYSMTALFGGQPGFSTEVELTFAPEGTRHAAGPDPAWLPRRRDPRRFCRRLERGVGRAHPR